MYKDKIYLLYGPPASGKSTLAQEISNSRGLEYISIGKITRAEILQRSDVGIQLKKCLDRNVVYPPKLISGVVKNYINGSHKHNKSLLFDGFPKYPAEVPPFLKILNAYNAIVPSIFIVNVPLETALLRVANRRICQKCLTQFSYEKYKIVYCPSCNGKLIIREDDEPKAFIARYRDFEVSINKTLEMLKITNAIVYNIKGDVSREIILDDILSKFD